MRYHWILGIVLFLALAPLAQGQTFETLHFFDSADGSRPYGGLVEGSDGSFYGTTMMGGAFGRGTVFKIKTDGTFISLVSFNNTNGAAPRLERLVPIIGGDFYGTTYSGGTSNLGTVFRIKSTGELTTLLSFTGANGSRPIGGIILGNDNYLYGTTSSGGSSSLGTVFKLTTNGVLTTLRSFNNIDGASPYARLVQGTDNFFYGTTYTGGASNNGTAYKISAAGAFTTLVSFNQVTGNYPMGGLIQMSDGNFYGTTYGNGGNTFGTVFKMTTAGAMTKLVTFNNTNGSLSAASMTLGADRDLYGTTQLGGAFNLGTVFKTTTNGVLTTLIHFNNTNGAFPYSVVSPGSDGMLYGTTYQGGPNNHGTIYRILMPVTLNLRVSGEELVLSWPTNALGFTLQSSPDLNSPTNWMDSTNAPAVVGAQFTVTNSISGSAQFYRLKKP